MIKIVITESEKKEILSLYLGEGLEHTKNLYKSWAKNKSGNFDESMKIMDDVLNYQKQLSKKDFANYSSYDELKKEIDVIKQKHKATDVTRLYEDNDLLVIAPNTHEASCKYGAGSKWCTTSKDTDSYWDRHNKTGTEFFWIFKKIPQTNPEHKYSYHIKNNNTSAPDWCNAINQCTASLGSLSYPKQHPKYDEILKKLKEFHNEREYVISDKIETKNNSIIKNWCKNNFEDLISNYINNFSLKEYIISFVSFNGETFIPIEMIDDDEGREKFFYDLEKYLLENINTDFDEDNENLIDNLAYVVKEIMEKDFNLDMKSPINDKLKNISSSDIKKYISKSELEELLLEDIDLTLDGMAAEFGYSYEY